MRKTYLFLVVLSILTICAVFAYRYRESLLSWSGFPADLRAKLPTLLVQQKLAREERELIGEITRYFEAEQYDEALQLALTVQNKNYSERFFGWIRSQLRSLYLTAGWQLLQQKNWEKALSYLLEADARYRDSQSIMGLVWAYTEMGDQEKAYHLAKTFLQVEPDHADLMKLYVRVLEETMKFDEAAQVAQKLMHLDKGSHQNWRQQFEYFLFRSQKQAQYGRIVTKNFRLSYDTVAHAEVLEHIISDLERALEELISVFRFQEPEEVIPITLYDAQDFSSTHPHWVKAGYDSQIRLPVTVAGGKVDYLPVLRHELVHALFDKTGKVPIPPWFEEGLAEWISRYPQQAVYKFETFPGKFLEAKNFEEAFTKQEYLMVHKLYPQSLYMLTFIYKHVGLDAIVNFIEAYPQMSKLSSNVILQRLETEERDFPQFLTRVSKLWDKRHSLENLASW